MLDWLGVIGAWALFAGPVYQAMLELRAQGPPSSLGSGSSRRRFAIRAPVE